MQSKKSVNSRNNQRENFGVQQYDPDTTSPFHDGFSRHTTEKCWAFKIKVQQLVNQKIIPFADLPNMAINPLPGHNGLTINVVTSELDNEVPIKDASKLRTNLEWMHDNLERVGLL